MINKMNIPTATKEKIISNLKKNIPQLLKELPHWIFYDSNKAPYQIKKPSTNASFKYPNTWGTFTDAINGLDKTDKIGMGFVIQRDKKIIGLDLDKCIINGEITKDALLIVDTFKSYTEYSISGTGLHIFITVNEAFNLAENPAKEKFKHFDFKELELMIDNSYLTMSGNVYNNLNTLENRDAEFKKFYSDLKSKKETEKKIKAPETQNNYKTKIDYNGEEIIGKLLKSKNANKFKSLFYEGNITEYGDDESRADFALCDMVAFYSKDANTIENIMRQSALYRDKWDAHPTYLITTINKAVNDTPEYNPNYKSNNTKTPNQEQTDKAANEIQETESEKELEKQLKLEKHFSKYGICYGGNCYMKAKKQTKEEEQAGKSLEFYPFTDFIIEPIEKIEGENGEIEIVAKVKSNIINRETLFNINDFNNMQKFKDRLKDFSIFNKAGTDDITGIKRYLLNEKEYKKKKGMASIGMYKINDLWVYVGNKTTIDTNNKDLADLCILPSSEVIKSNITDSQEITKEELKKIGKSLFHFNKTENCMAIMGTIGAFFLKEKFRTIDIETHILQLMGEKGSGKSQTMKNIIGEIFGTNTRDIRKADDFKEFTLTKSLSSSNLIPLFIDEYKPFTMAKNKIELIHSYLRSVYDGTGTDRGRPDQTIRHYHLLAPVIIAGEAHIQDHAVIERSCIIRFAKTNIQEPEINKSYKTLIDNKEILNKLGKSLLMLALKKDLKTLKEEYKAAEEQITENIKVDRTKTTIKNILAGLNLIGELLEQHSLNFEEITGISPEEAVKMINDIVFEDTLESCEEGKSIIDDTIETFERMVINGELQAGQDYIILNKGSEIALNIKSIYDKFTKYIGDHRISQEVLPHNVFTKQLRKEKYFVDYKTVTAEKKNKLKMYVLNIDQLKEKNIEIEGFFNQN